MDRNTLMFFALSFGIMVVWYGLFPPQEPESPVDPGSPVEQVAQTERNRAGEPPRPGEVPGVSGTDAEPAPSELVDNGEAPSRKPEEKITVRTGLYEAVLTSRGGGLLSWKLLEYDDAMVEGRPNIEMVTLGEDWDLALGTPLRGLGQGNLSRLDYEVDRPDGNTVVFTRDVRGVQVRKVYSFSDDDYQVRLRIEIDNRTDRYVRPDFKTVWPARVRESGGFLEFSLAAFSDGDLESFIIDPPDMLFGGGGSDEAFEVQRVEWAGAHSRYFLAAIAPDREAEARFQPVVVESEAVLLVRYAETDVPPGTRLDREYRVYLGPKEPDRIDAIDKAHGLHLSESILRGWIPSLTRLFEQALEAAHDVIPNYGLAILLITLLVRLVMAPMMAKQMKSMKKISAIQPAIKEMQAKYPDDREKQSAAMMEVYKEHGMSPFSMFSGCLPMFLQLPVFIGFYYALQSSISLRQQPFFGWIDDLSQPESLFTLPGLDLPVRVLPLLMGISMFLQQKFTPNTMDPAQARMMLWMMPIMFTFMFYQFASGLVLYWFTSTLIGIAQQVLTNRRAD